MYSIVISGGCKKWIVDTISYDYYIVDFSVGFCSKLLPGAIFNFLFEEINRENISRYISFWMVICFILISFLLERLINRVDSKHRNMVLLFVLFFLTGPFTFAPYIEQFGMLDLSWLIISVFLVLFISNKYTYILIIPLFVASAFIHFSAIFCFIPFFMVLSLCRLMYIKNKKEKVFLLLIIIISCLLSLIFCLYFAALERENLCYTLEQFDDFLISRGSDYRLYYEYSFYRRVVGENMADYGYELSYDGTSPVFRFLSVIGQQVTVNIDLIKWRYFFADIILSAPILFFLFVFIKSEINNTLNRFKKFVLVCNAALFFVPLMGCVLFSTDVTRWFSHSFLSCSVCFLYYLYKEEKSDFGFINECMSRVPSMFILIYAILYMTSTATIYN